MIVQKCSRRKKYFEINNSQTRVCLSYVNLATVQIWGQSKKFPLICNSLKCLLQAKKFIRENSDKKNLLLHKPTPPTNAFNWVLRSLSSVWNVFSRGEIYARISKTPLCFAMRSRRRDNFSVARFFLELVWQNGEDEKRYEHWAKKAIKRKRSGANVHG